MPNAISNIHNAEYQQGQTSRAERWQHLDLSGEHLGVRVEILEPGASSSYAHFHTQEEEHVLVLEGEATLHYGKETLALSGGDHAWFRAGEPLAHRIVNDTNKPFKFLVFGERKIEDVVIYPEGNTAYIKSLKQQFRYNAKEGD